jgi:hypothetical protein
MSVAKKTILLTEVTEKQNDIRSYLEEGYLFTKTRYLKGLKPLKQPILNYLMPYYFTKINN